MDYNKRFGKVPHSTHDAHRPLREVDELERILSGREERTMSSQRVVHYKRGKYIIEPNDGGCGERKVSGFGFLK